METPEVKAFYSAVHDLREALESDLSLDDFERLSLENYMALLQMTYIEWKQRNAAPPAYKKAA